MLKQEYDLMNDTYYLEFMGLRVPDSIGIILYNLGLVEDTTIEK